jgi:Transposase DDE domain
VDVPKVPPRSAISELAALIDSPEVAELVSELEETRWTGRPGYPIRSMFGMALVKSMYAIPTWSRTARLVAEHDGLSAILGCAPSVYACYRFAAKLRLYSDKLDARIASVLASLRDEMPEMGRDVSIDASDLPAYANGQRYVSKGGRERERFSDPDASWGHRSAVSTRKGGGFYGYRVHAVVCARTDLPLAWEVSTAASHESNYVAPLLDAMSERGFAAETCALDKGYDVGPIYEACEDRGCRPIIPLRETTAVKRGDHKPPRCEHGEWRFAGSDSKRGASKWRCPTGGCKPASQWIKADRLHPLIPRETPRWRKLYKGRASVEREFGRLKHEWSLLPLRVRGIERVRLHADLTILAKLGCALARARAVPLAA